MSIESITSFIERLSVDMALQARVGAAVKDKEGQEAAEAVAAVGAEYGFNFTAAEAADAHAMVTAEDDGGDRELSDLELEAVAGGGWDADAAGRLRGTVRDVADWNTRVLGRHGSRVSEDVSGFFRGW